MKVLYVANAAQIGGGNRSLLVLAAGLQKSGRSVVALPTPGTMREACEAEKIECIVRPRLQPSWKDPLKSCLDLVGWRRELRDRKVDLIHANDPTTARPLLLPARSRGIPVVVHVRFPTSPKVVEWVFRGLPKPVLLIFNSYALQSECGPGFAQAYPGLKQLVVHNAVDLAAFRPLAANEQTPRERFRVGIVANLVPVKGHDDFLRMAAVLTGRGVDVEYSIIGTETAHKGHEAHLRTIARDLGIGQRVQFLGHRNDIPELINQLDIVVCASTVEPFGRCLIEAMACGKPVVATAVGGIPEVVEDGVTGLLVPPRSSEQMADAVQSLLADETRRRQFGESGRRRAVELFASETHVARILSVYEQLLVECRGFQADG
jgi:glycosyltransferase involved in cell wall biosynthesis